MKLKTLVAFVAAGLLSASAFAADATVKITDVHLCCNNCVTGVNNALKTMTTVKATCNRDQATGMGTVDITAPDTATAQKAVDTLIMAGYFGKSADSSIKMEAPKADAAKVQTLQVQGVHLCCPACVTAVKGVLNKTEGVKADTSTVVARAPTIVVNGDFSPKTLFEALNAAGLAGHLAAAAPATRPAN